MNSEHEFPPVRIRIKKKPSPSEFAEFDVKGFSVGDTFDVPSGLATLLILAGNAEPVVGRGKLAEAADTGFGWPNKPPKPPD